MLAHFEPSLHFAVENSACCKWPNIEKYFRHLVTLVAINKLTFFFAQFEVEFLNGSPIDLNINCIICK